MPQSMMALCAMMVATLFAMDMQRSIVRTHVDMVQDELELMSNGMGLMVLDRIGTLAFDDIDMYMTAAEITDGEDLLTAETGHAKLALQVNGETVWFKLRVDDVYYVSGQNASEKSSTPTDYKRVFLVVKPIMNQARYSPEFTLSRVFARPV